MDIFLTMHKTDFYQQTVTTLPPPYLVTIIRLDLYHITTQLKKIKGGGEWIKNQEKKTLQLKLEELSENSNILFFTVWNSA